MVMLSEEPGWKGMTAGQGGRGIKGRVEGGEGWHLLLGDGGELGREVLQVAAGGLVGPGVAGQQVDRSRVTTRDPMTAIH